MLGESLIEDDEVVDCGEVEVDEHLLSSDGGAAPEERSRAARVSGTNCASSASTWSTTPWISFSAT